MPLRVQLEYKPLKSDAEAAFPLIRAGAALDTMHALPVLQRAPRMPDATLAPMPHGRG